MKRRTRVRLLGLVIAEVLVGTTILYWVAGTPGNGPHWGKRIAGAERVAPFEQPAPIEGAPTPKIVRPRVWLGVLPPALFEAVRGWAEMQAYELSSDEAPADLVVGWQRDANAYRLADVILVPAVSFPSLREDVAADELRAAWRGRRRAHATFSTLLVPAEIAGGLEALLGSRDATAPVAVVPAQELIARLAAEPDALALVPFDALEPRLQALRVDGLSALDRALDVLRYPLTLAVWAGGEEALCQALATEIRARNLDTNRFPERLTVLAMTGVTALTRRVAIQIEARGDPGWPVDRVAEVLAGVDLTHVSNEVSFMPGCTPDAEATAFCARPEYLEALRRVGADIVELTGNHNLDYGPEPALLSLDLYAEAGMRTFGGGRNAAEARRPLLVEHNGNRLAFLGYNQFGPDYAWATFDGPGAAFFSLDAVQADVAAIRQEADVVFVNLQHTEGYSTAPLPEQVADFRAVAQAGADVVTGSQAHLPQAIEFYDGRPIFYGLGNLFFQQAWSEDTRHSVIVRHTIYQGRVIAAELIPTVMGEDGQARLAEGKERDAILQAVIEASAILASE